MGGKAGTLSRMLQAIGRGLSAAFGRFSVSYTPPSWTRRKARAAEPVREPAAAAEPAAPEARPASAEQPGAAAEPAHAVAEHAAAEHAAAEHAAVPFLRRKSTQRITAAAVLVAAIAAVTLLVVLRPKGLDVSVSPPGPKPLEENASIPPLQIGFSGSAAKIELEGKDISDGVTMDPKLPGAWVWSDDSTIIFFPSADWEIGRSYSVTMNASIFSDRVQLKTRSVSFRTAELEGRIENAQFYIDPTDPGIKRITATVSFTHPVKTADVEKAVKLDYPFTVSYDSFFATAYIVSGNIPVPDKTASARLKVSGRISPAAGGSALSADMMEEVTIPGRFDYAGIEGVETALARNESYEYQKLLVVSANLGVRPADLGGSLWAWLLPKDRPELPGAGADKDHEWSVVEVDQHVLDLSTRLELVPAEIEGEFGTQVSFRCNAPSGRFIYVEQKKQIEAMGGYLIKPVVKSVVQVPAIPKEVKIMSEGSLLSMSGDRKISLFSNDLAAVRFEIGRIIPDQVNNLVTQTQGDFADLTFQDDWSFNVENISSMFQETMTLKKLEPGQVQYFSFDFDRYLQREEDPRMKYGLFWLKVTEWDPVNRREGHASDERLILVTDLGLLVKKNVSTGFDVFVQSIRTGAPVADAIVEVVGKNGLAVVSGTTGGDGHASFPNLKGYVREKTPEVFVVKRGSDMSFLPVERSGRFLNYSRFDTGGVYGSADPEFIDAYLFSDRGIYRPGDAMNFGIIVKAGDWTKSLAGLPLELTVEDPRGLAIQTQKIALSGSGFEQYTFSTMDTSQTGLYTVSISIARDNEEKKLLGATTVKVEEFQPDRLTIRSVITTDTESVWISPENLTAKVSLMNLFGTPAAGNEVRARLTLYPASLYVPTYPEYVFFDPLQAEKSYESDLDGKLTDSGGSAEFPIDLSSFDKGTYSLLFSADGMEKQGGRSVAAQTAVIVSPLASVIGYKPDGGLDYLFKNAARSVHFICVGPDQAAASLSGLTLSINEVRFVSVLEKSPDGLFRYKSVEKKVPVKETALAIPRQGYTLKLPTDAPGDFEVSVSGADGVKLSTLRYSVMGSGNLSRSLDRNAELQVRLDKSDYAAGEEIRVSVKGPYTGSGLITIERDKVYAYRWFATDSTASVQTIRVPEGLEGSAYVNVSFIRAADSREIYTSPLSYGVAPFSINRAARTNPITLKADDQMLAGKPLSITYSTPRPGKIVVFAVDEGILQVAGYRTPAPLDHFMAKRALEVQTSQILDLILPEFSMVQALSAMGGDEGEALRRGLNPFKRKNKPPVVFWSGILSTDSTPRTVEYAVPDFYNGTLRIMAVAISEEAMGAAQKRTVVRNNFVITPNVPPVVSPGDEFDVGVSVMNDLPGKDAETEVKIVCAPSTQFELLTPAAVTQKIAKLQEKTVFFKVRVKNVLGSGTLTFVASGGGLSSSLEEAASIRPAVPFRTEVVSGAGTNAVVELPVARKMHPEFRSIITTASYLPSGMSYGLKRFLDSYPYGCTEQIVSRAFPSIALKGLADFGVTDKEAADSFAQAQKILRFRQNQEGGFGLWAANTYSSPFVTAYAMHYLTDAKEAGYPVDRALMLAGLDHLRSIAGGEQENASTVAAAYAIYVLTRNGEVTTGYINTLLSSKDLDRKWKEGPVAVFLSGAYALMKKDGEARSLLSGAFNAGWDPLWGDDYYTDLTQTSLCLYMAARHAPDLARALGAKAVEAISQGVTGSKYNTISSSYSILALTRYASLIGDAAGDKLKAARKIAEKQYEDLSLSGDAVLSAVVPYGSLGVRISNTTGFRLYYQLVQSGFDLEPPAKVVKNGIEVFREYTDENGRSLEAATVGTDITVHVKIRSIDPKRTRITNVAIVDMLPSGFELVYDRASADAFGSGSLEADYVEPREDRVLVFCTAESSVRELTYTIRPTSKGKFAVPPVFAESMYDKSVWTQHPSEGFITVGD